MNKLAATEAAEAAEKLWKFSFWSFLVVEVAAQAAPAL